jgi:hypothetical protein
MNTLPASHPDADMALKMSAGARRTVRNRRTNIKNPEASGFAMRTSLPASPVGFVQRHIV